MHRLPSQSAISRFRLAALLYILSYITLIGAIGYMAWAIFGNDQKHHILYAACAVALWVVLVISQWVVASRARCPLCLVPAMAKRNCSKNRNAKRMLGSYRMRVATSILTKNSFRCPYCNEPTALEVRQRKNV